MFDEFDPVDLHDRLDRFVAELLDAAGIAEPPIDAVALAQRHLGIDLELDADTDEESRHAAAAHAVGERLKPELLRALGIDPTQKRGMLGRSLAGLLADRLLVPTAWLADAGRACGWDLPQLKHRFVTASHERIALRLLDLDEPCVISILDDDRIVKRRSNAQRVTKQLSTPEKKVQAYVHRHERAHELSADGWRVQGWPVPNSRSKREILRSVMEEM